MNRNHRFFARTLLRVVTYSPQKPCWLLHRDGSCSLFVKYRRTSAFWGPSYQYEVILRTAEGPIVTKKVNNSMCPGGTTANVDRPFQGIFDKGRPVSTKWEPKILPVPKAMRVTTARRQSQFGVLVSHEGQLLGPT